ncbi:hypothetical protein [Candidatus Palauibacter sp.]|uniref:hypothetical protein n=1 Tax=Candidatus Palauibacter sp. TaxID=3101350 RepID=UPI003D0B9F59
MIKKNAGKPEFQRPEDALSWLERALEMERLKYAAVPVEGDLVPRFVSASAWGYVTAAYTLIEQALKTLIDQTIGFDSTKLPARLRETHSLKTLFDHLDTDDRRVLEDLYRDYWLTEGAGSMGFSLDEMGAFLGHLDQGHGSISWRYSLTEEIAAIPQLGPVYVEHMWETVRCVLGVIRHHALGYPPVAHSIVKWQERRRQYVRWLNLRLRSGELSQTDRIELLRGPDSRGRSDFCVFRGKSVFPKFGDVDAAAKQAGLEVVNMQREIAALTDSEGSSP